MTLGAIGGTLGVIGGTVTALSSFSPLDLSPTLWLDAADTSTITDSGGAVSLWADKSGNGYDVAQASASLQPTTGAATLNGLNVVSFDGSQWIQAATASDWRFLNDGTEHSIFIVFSAGAVANPNVYYFVLGTVSSGNGGGAYLLWEDRSTVANDAVRHGVKNSGGALVVNNLSANDRVPSTTATAVTITASPGASPASDRSALRFNGATGDSNNTDALAPSTSNPVWPLVVGSARRADTGAALGPLVGTVAELVIFDRALSVDDRDAVEGYLAAKWGL